jgi:hypothetical protein
MSGKLNSSATSIRGNDPLPPAGNIVLLLGYQQYPDGPYIVVEVQESDDYEPGITTNPRIVPIPLLRGVSS